MPRTRGVEKAQIRLRVAKALAEYATGRGADWFEAVLREKRDLELQWARAALAQPGMGAVPHVGAMVDGIVKANGHHKDCGWHLDQYPWECDCGLISGPAGEPMGGSDAA